VSADARCGVSDSAYDADFGVMISARTTRCPTTASRSSAGGHKLDDAAEDRIENSSTRVQVAVPRWGMEVVDARMT